MKVKDLVDFKREDIKILHWTWIAFFITFFVWFNMAPLASTMLNKMGWLTKEHIKVLAICNVALTIPGRIVIGAMIDKFGPRLIFSGLMIVMAIPAILFAFGNTFIQLVISRLILSVIGAGFVIGIRMVAQWFPPKNVGFAEGFYAGWGNFGSAAAAMLMPWIALSVFGAYEDGWRYALAFNGLVSFFYGIAYFFLVKDIPKDGATKSYHFKAVEKAQPMTVTSYGDLIQYLVWSFPLLGAIGVLVWRVSGIIIAKGTPQAHQLLPQNYAIIIYVVLGLMYVAHVMKVLQVNLAGLKKGYPKEEKYHWGSVAALNSTYFANFGAELAVVSMLPFFFEKVFTITPTMAGLIAASFAFVNLVARPLGGYISDRVGSRKKTMLFYMIGIAAGFFAMGFIAKYGPMAADGTKTLVPMFQGTWWIIVAVFITVGCSMFVQGAEGATFAIIPVIKKNMTGQIAGMAGAYGNVGAVIYLVIYSLVDAKTFFYIIGAGAAISFLFCWLMLEDPKDAHSEH